MLKARTIHRSRRDNLSWQVFDLFDASGPQRPMCTPEEAWFCVIVQVVVGLGRLPEAAPRGVSLQEGSLTTR